MNGMAPERDEAALFSDMFEEHFDDLWRFARRRCNSSSDADDIVAETFAVAWRRRADVPVDATRLWLFGVARHVLNNQRRSSVRRDRLRLRLITTTGSGSMVMPPNSSTTEHWAPPSQDSPPTNGRS